MLEQKITQSREVLQRYVDHSLKVSRLALDFQVSAQVRLVDHELILGCRHDGGRVLALTNVSLRNL